MHSVVQVFDHNFGAGLDFLLTWTLWLQAKEDNQQLQGLNYVALCEQPLCLTDLQQLHQNWPQLETLSLQLQVQYPPAIKGFHQLDFGQVRLTIVQAESTLALEQIKSQFDVFLGGPESKPHKAYTPPWQRSSMGATAAGKVAIIGAGISGVASAYSLSRRGFDVTLIEQGPALASAASGTTVTFNIDSTVATLVGSQTFTNKTFTSPTISAMTFASGQSTSGLNIGANGIIFEGATADAHETTLTAADPTADHTITIPNTTMTAITTATHATQSNHIARCMALG